MFKPKKMWVHAKTGNEIGSAPRPYLTRSGSLAYASNSKLSDKNGEMNGVSKIRYKESYIIGLFENETITHAIQAEMDIGSGVKIRQFFGKNNSRVDEEFEKLIYNGLTKLYGDKLKEILDECNMILPETVEVENE